MDMSEFVEWAHTEPNGYWLFAPFIFVVVARLVLAVRDIAKEADKEMP